MNLHLMINFDFLFDVYFLGYILFLFLFAVWLVKGGVAGDVPLLVERMRNHLTSKLASGRNI